MHLKHRYNDLFKRKKYLGVARRYTLKRIKGKASKRELNFNFLL